MPVLFTIITKNAMAISITTHTTQEDLTGKSHWWGAPDLPDNMPYPCITCEDEEGTYEEPLTFVCQIRCADIASLDPENLLPHTGMLYFFAPIAYFLGETDSPLDYHDAPAVIYSAQETGLSPYRLEWEDSGESVFSPAEAITFSPLESPRGDGHILLGLPYQEEILTAHPHCISLLQIDEDDRWGLRFYDCGMYYFLIQPRHLRAHQWDKTEGDLFFY